MAVTLGTGRFAYEIVGGTDASGFASVSVRQSVTGSPARYQAR